MALDLNTLLWLMAIIAAGALFWRGQGIRQSALAATRRYCQREEVSLLDQTVALHRLRLRRLNHRWRLLHVYRFEFTVTGGERYHGETLMHGHRPVRVSLPPHRFEPPTDPGRTLH